MSRRNLIVGNWKMHGTVSESLKRITALGRKLEDIGTTDVVVAPPHTALYSAAIAAQDTGIKVAAQNMHWEADGAYTGEVSATFLTEVGCEFVLIGHSERRKLFHEKDEQLNKKLHAALAHELGAIFCIGETNAEREAGQTFERLKEQLKIGLHELHIHDIEGLNIAYEPVWAIGTGNTATTEQINEVHNWIRAYLEKNFDGPTANSIRLLYGGSVKPENAKSLIACENVDGLLVGGASLDPDDFVAIIEAVA